MDPVMSNPHNKSMRATSRPEQTAQCEIPADELKWRQIGSGMWAKTFLNMDRLVTTGKNGPAACDVARRVIRGIRAGKGNRRLRA